MTILSLSHDNLIMPVLYSLQRSSPLLGGGDCGLQHPLPLDDPDDVDDEDQVHHHDQHDQGAQTPDAVPGVHPTAAEKKEGLSHNIRVKVYV